MDDRKNISPKLSKSGFKKWFWHQVEDRHLLLDNQNYDELMDLVREVYENGFDDAWQEGRDTMLTQIKEQIDPLMLTATGPMDDTSRAIKFNSIVINKLVHLLEGKQPPTP